MRALAVVLLCTSALLWLPLRSADAQAPEACADDPLVKLTDDLLFLQANLDPALAVSRQIDLSDLAPECQVYVFDLRGYMSLLRQPPDEPTAARAYLSILDRAPDYTTRFSTNEAVDAAFKSAKRRWRRTHAGPPEIEPDGIGFESLVGEVPDQERWLVIRSQSDGELSWTLDSANEWLKLSRTSGTTRGRVDSVRVHVETPMPPVSPIELSGSITIVSGPFPDRPRTTVRWRVKGAESPPWWLFAAGGAVQVLGVYYLFSSSDEVTRVELNEPPGPPGRER